LFPTFISPGGNTGERSKLPKVRQANAQKVLRGLSGEIVGLARARSDDNPIFTHAADPFLEVYEGKRLQSSCSFCQDWLWQGLLHADGLKLSSERYDIRKTDKMASLAIDALEGAFGKQWQDHKDVAKEFNFRSYKYSTREGAITWAEMSRGVRRELVRKTLRTAARAWERQSNKIRSKKPKT
jgi:hypothetical protein